MFYPIMEKIAEILENATSPGGHLDGVQNVLIGNYTILPDVDFPAALVEFSGSELNGNKARAGSDMEFFIRILSIKPNDQLSLSELSGFFWNIETQKGLIPLLVENSGFVIGSQSYKMDIERATVTRGQDTANRFLWAVTVPVKVVTWTRLI